MLQQTIQYQDLGNEDQIKLIKGRIDLVETHFGNMCSSFGSYVGKTAVLRDRGDHLSRILKDYANAETVNRSMRTKLSHFADSLTSVEDYRQTLIERVETNVIGQLSPYESICKSAKENLKTTIRVNNRHLERRRQLQKIREKFPVNRQNISIAETELTKAKGEAAKSCKSLTDSMQKFEQKKIQDIKRILLNFVKSETLFHAKALELYTQAFNHIKSIDEDEDLQEWYNCMSLSLPPGMNQLSVTHNHNTSKSRESVQSVTSHLQTSEDNTTDDDDDESDESRENSQTEI